MIAHSYVNYIKIIKLLMSNNLLRYVPVMESLPMFPVLMYLLDPDNPICTWMWQAELPANKANALQKTYISLIMFLLTLTFLIYIIVT